ncbi:MAG: S-layer homology domain-containing protein [Candidatus Ornithomonoglobus sp.]
MKKLTKLLSCAVAMALCMGIGVSASAFSDMPDGEMGEALQRAVDVGLMDGVTNDLIAPNDNITRAQMATIIVRAFSAADKSSAKFNDVAADAWYADYVSKASAMGAFEGDDDNNFKPENNITFQETYIVLSRMFGFEPYELRYSDGTTSLLGDCNESVLSSFSDKDEVASWAKNYAKYIVGNGGWQGIDGKLKPTASITRGEFAILMDKIVTTYIDEPGTYTDLPDGLTMVRSGGVKIDGLNTSHNLIITYGVDEKGCEVTNSTVKGVTLVLGGVDKTPKETTDNNGEKKLTPDESYVTIAGTYHDVRVNTAYVYLNASAASVEYYKGVKNSLVSLSFN